jgi:hypothetical protein
MVYMVKKARWVRRGLMAVEVLTRGGAWATAYVTPDVTGEHTWAQLLIAIQYGYAADEAAVAMERAPIVGAVAFADEVAAWRAMYHVRKAERIGLFRALLERARELGDGGTVWRSEWAENRAV